MKTIKVRFIKKWDSYNIQYKRGLSWFYYYELGQGFPYPTKHLYFHKSKTHLLKRMLKNEYNTCLGCVRVKEYPTIKIH